MYTFVLKGNISLLRDTNPRSLMGHLVVTSFIGGGNHYDFIQDVLCLIKKTTSQLSCG